ncbi:MAG: primosomal protein N' [Ideonella sp.]|jgi:primosomal protein N' (replication factor Y)|nr:primosomal protein N' [Ideonella sp.]
MTARVPVVVDPPLHSGLGATLTYCADAALTPGTLVRVPLGPRTVTGVAWDPPAGAEAQAGPPDDALRPVTEILDLGTPLGAAWRHLVSFAAGYYQRAPGEVALAVLPPELRTLTAAQLDRRRRRRAAPRAPADDPATVAATDAAPALEPGQRAAVDALVHATGAACWLLHGVTGSGKTEVYLHAAAAQLAAGRQVLLLVPEINLTPQLESRLAARFGGHRLVTLHSGLTPAQRLGAWLDAHEGRADLVLGTRLAVFASLPRLGLIVVDEEHDASYKQQEGARYSARDLAVYRGRLEGVPVVLGSATPSLETWHNAEQGRYRRLSLPGRIGDGGLPRVRVVDLRPIPAATLRQHGGLAPALREALQQRLDAGEQALLLLNRRGYAPVLHCGECGWKSDCAHCSAWRVFHKADRTLRCHHCGATDRVPRACPACGNLDITPVGQGTERLEEQLAGVLRGPGGGPARIARLDADVARHRGALEARLAAVHAGEVDVLVGTQMLAKGHDFRRVTLVAALNADGALFSSDFRAAERLFSLLMQAAGRAGRDAAQSARSEMWVQTANPQHPLFAALVRHDFEAFAAQQLAERAAVGLPPFHHLALLRADARTPEAALGYLAAAAEAARALDPEGAITCSQPVPTPVARVADVERAQLLVESPSRAALGRFLAAWMPELHTLRAAHRGVLRWAVDVDPLAI